MARLPRGFNNWIDFYVHRKSEIDEISNSDRFRYFTSELSGNGNPTEEISVSEIKAFVFDELGEIELSLDEYQIIYESLRKDHSNEVSHLKRDKINPIIEKIGNMIRLKRMDPKNFGK